MRTIHKFQLLPRDIGERFTVEMPDGATVVRVATQGPNYQPWLWADVDTDAETVKRQFIIVGTGQEIEAGSTHCATWEAGPFVWHLFEPADVGIPEALRPHLPTLQAQNAYRTLIKAGFELMPTPNTTPAFSHWKAPSDESLTTEEMMAVAELQEYGFGSVA